MAHIAFPLGQHPTDAADASIDRTAEDAILFNVLVYGYHSYAGNPIHRLNVGDRVYGYAPGAGYFGVGTVTAPPARLVDFEEYDEMAGLYAYPGAEDSEDGGAGLYVRVDWARRRPFNPVPYHQIGFAPQTPVAIRDLGIVRELEAAFGLAPAATKAAAPSRWSNADTAASPAYLIDPDEPTLHPHTISRAWIGGVARSDRRSAHAFVVGDVEAEGTRVKAYDQNGRQHMAVHVSKVDPDAYAEMLRVQGGS